jgi:hypothetical protein
MRERRPYGSVGGAISDGRPYRDSPITNRSLAATPDSIQTQIEEVRGFVQEGILNLRNLLNENGALAKAELHRHLDEVRMAPSNEGKDWCYVATGDWDLLGVDSKLDSGRQSSDWRLEMVAGVRDVLKIPPIPFCVEMLRPRAASRFGVWVRFPSPAP